jgi:hypothetical protein
VCGVGGGGGTWRHPGTQSADDGAELPQGMAVGQVPGCGWAITQVVGMTQADVASGAAFAFHGTQVEVAMADRTLSVVLYPWLHPDLLLHPASLETAWTDNRSSDDRSSSESRTSSAKTSWWIQAVARLVEVSWGGGERWITLHHITSHHITSHHITLHHITLHYITLHYITLHYITLHYITLHYITLHYIALHHMPAPFINRSVCKGRDIKKKKR